MNHELAKTLTTALVQFIDREIPEGVMCCSSYECEKIEKAFEGGTYDVVEKLIKKKLSGLTEFENAFIRLLSMSQGEPPKGIEDFAKEHSKELLALAKKELARLNEVITLDKLQPYDKGFQDGKAEAMADLERTFECNSDKLPKWLKEELGKKHLDGYCMGREDTLREMKDFIESYFTNKTKEGEDLTDLYRKEYERNPQPIPPGVAYKSPQCYTDVMVAPNINSGTSTAKEEG